MTGQVEQRAYLEHYRHAPLIIKSILHSHGPTQRNSALGFRIVVNARYDRMVGADDQLVVRDPIGEKVDEEVRLNLFCRTGMGFEGYHYEPLVWRGGRNSELAFFCLLNAILHGVSSILVNYLCKRPEPQRDLRNVDVNEKMYLCR